MPTAETQSSEEIMNADGYVLAADAARAVGSQVSTLHRAIQGARVLGVRAGQYWYVSVAALMEKYKGVPVILDRIKAMGVKPNPAHLVAEKPKKVRRGK